MSPNRTFRRQPIHYGVGSFSYLVLSILILICIAALQGCSGSQIGPSWDKKPDGAVASRNASPNRVSLSKGGETWDAESAVPGSYVEMFDKDGNAVASLGPKSRVMIFPWFGQEVKLASDTDVTISIDEATLQDGTLMKGFTFSTLASPVIKAQNEVWDRLGPVLIARDQEAAKTLLSDNEALGRIVEAVGPGILDVIKAIATGGL